MFRSISPGPEALYRDPPVDQVARAETLPQAIPSGAVMLNAVLYTAAGQGPHPTVLLLRGMPGNEQNIDLAQSIRRAGSNVLTLHYRGSWGTPGHFAFEHCLADAAAAINWLREPPQNEALKLDSNRIALVGHSIGAFVVAHTAARAQAVLASVMISVVNLADSFGRGDNDAVAARVDRVAGMSAGLHILSGTSPEMLAEEARLNADHWRLTNYAVDLSRRPLLLVSSDDGYAECSHALAAAIGAIDGSRLSCQHFATDHSYSDHRIRLQTAVLQWLAAIGFLK
jgi:uncharacterized protein